MYAQEKDRLIAKNAKVELAATGFIFTEGPAVDLDGKVYFTDQPNDRIYILDEQKKLALYLEGTGRSNGMYFNEQRVLVTCADEKKQLGYFDENKNLRVIYENYDGKYLNGPHDIWIHPHGGIYFSDPYYHQSCPYYHQSWWADDHTEVQDTQGVYFVNLSRDIIRVIDNLENLTNLSEL